MSFERFIGKYVNGFAGRYQDRLGIANTRRLAKAYNNIRYYRLQRRHDEAFHHHFNALLTENNPGFTGKARNLMTDGWAIDRSGDLPFIEEALRHSDELIATRGGKDNRGKPMAQQDFLFDLISPPYDRMADMVDYPGIADFGLSSEVLATVAEYMGSIPVFSRTRPPGIRLFESSNRFDENAGGPYRESQFYHLDLHDHPLIYAILLARDVSSSSGPWRFLPKSVSDRAARHLKYQRRGQAYRVTDEHMYEAVDPSESIEFTGKRGDVLFIDSSRCFHYGSRNANPPRYQIMYAYTTNCRSDFTLMIQRPYSYPFQQTDSVLRKMVLGAAPLA